MTVEGETGQESVGDPEERSETECSMKEEGRGKGPRERRGRVGPLLDGVVHCDADANANADIDTYALATHTHVYTCMDIMTI